VVHELEVAAYGNHGMPPTVAEPPPLVLPSSSQASNKTVQLGTAISLPVDDVLARMSPNTPTEDSNQKNAAKAQHSCSSTHTSCT
jgi:hypothetical protein